MTAAYNKLMTSKHVDLNWKPNPTVKIIRGGWNVWEPEGDNYGAAMNDAATAYQCALVWRITGDERYAEKSVERKCPVIPTAVLPLGFMDTSLPTLEN